MMNIRQTYTFQGQPLPETAYDSKNGTYSLVSRRQIKGSSRTGYKSVDVGYVLNPEGGENQGPFIYGSVTDHLREFFIENGLDISKINVKTPRKTVATPSSQQVPSTPGNLGNLGMGNLGNLGMVTPGKTTMHGIGKPLSGITQHPGGFVNPPLRFPSSPSSHLPSHGVSQPGVHLPGQHPVDVPQYTGPVHVQKSYISSPVGVSTGLQYSSTKKPSGTPPLVPQFAPTSSHALSPPFAHGDQNTTAIDYRQTIGVPTAVPDVDLGFLGGDTDDESDDDDGSDGDDDFAIGAMANINSAHLTGSSLLVPRVDHNVKDVPSLPSPLGGIGNVNYNFAPSATNPLGVHHPPSITPPQALSSRQPKQSGFSFIPKVTAPDIFIPKDSRRGRSGSKKEGKSDGGRDSLKDYTGPVCKIGEPSVYKVPKGVNDVEQIPDEAIENMCDFSLDGLWCKAKVTDIIDGDTIRILVYIHLNHMVNGRDIKVGRGRGVHMEKRYPILTHDSDGFFCILKVRMLGIDTAEKDTFHGQHVINEIKEKYRSLNNIVWVKISKPDKYGGRNLADVYEDPGYKKSINLFLLSVLYQGQKCALPYDGGTKSDYLKKLPKIPKKQKAKKKVATHDSTPCGGELCALPLPEDTDSDDSSEGEPDDVLKEYGW